MNERTLFVIVHICTTFVLFSHFSYIEKKPQGDKAQHEVDSCIWDLFWEEKNMKHMQNYKYVRLHTTKIVYDNVQSVQEKCIHEIITNAFTTDRCIEFFPFSSVCVWAVSRALYATIPLSLTITLSPSPHLLLYKFLYAYIYVYIWKYMFLYVFKGWY